MSEAIRTTGRAAQSNVEPYRIEMPSDPVGVNLVPHHVTDKDGGIARTGKIEVRFNGSTLPKRDDARRTIMWEKAAYNVAQQMAYYRQVYDNIVALKEEAERKYSNAVLNEGRLARDLERLSPFINAAYHLRSHWAFFLLPKSFRKLVSAV